MKKIKRRQFLGWTATAVVLPVAGGMPACRGNTGTAGRPNFILIQLDDLGWDDISLHGNQYVETPHLDRLAGESVQFSQFYVNPVCAPTRASLLTGRHFLRTGVAHVHGGKDFIHLDEVLLPEVLQRAGYATGMWGKWHSGHTDGYFPWERGFDEAYMARLYKHENSRGQLNGEPVEHEKWADEVIVDYALDFITSNMDRPFFAYLSFLTCHAPLHAPRPFVEKYLAKGLPENLAILYGMIDHVDDHIGRFLSDIEKLGLKQNTLVMFMSDNGPAIINNYLTDADRDIRYVNKLKGHKGNIWENGVKSPLFVRWPERLQPDTVNTLADVTDILPTLMDLAGIKPQKQSPPLDGTSLKPALFGRKQDNVKLSYNYANPGWPPTDKPWSPLGIKGEYRPVTAQQKQAMNFSDQIISVRNSRYKLLLNPGKVKNGVTPAGGYALFDILQDPREENNLITEKPETAEKLKHELETWFDGITEAEHAFRMPVFLIGDGGKKRSTVWAKGPVENSAGLKNTFNSLNDWQKGDYAVYHIDVKTAGRYRVAVYHDSEQASGARVQLAVKDRDITAAVTDNQEFGLHEIDLPAGESFVIFRVVENGRIRPAIRRLVSILFERL